VEFVAGNIFVRPMTFAKRGDVVQGHAHNFDHTTFALFGSVRVVALLPNGERQEVDLRQSEFPGDRRVYALIKAGVQHEITCTSEGGAECWCVYSHRDPQGEVVQEWTGWLPATL
jgi:hypothetical protein